VAVVKRSVTLDEEVASAIEAAVGGRGFSGWLNDAAHAKLDRDNVQALLADLDAEFGPVPAEDLEAARRRWAAIVADGPEPEERPVDLMAALESTVRAADPRSTRARKGAAGSGIRIRVEPRADGRWAVQRDGTRRASFVADRKGDAVARARTQAREQGAEVVIKNADGSVQATESPRPAGRAAG
jgi:hypothetical protein